MLKNNIYNIILILFIILEGLFAFVFNLQCNMTQEFTSIGYFTVSFLFGFVILFKFYNIPALSVLDKPKVIGRYILYPLMAVSSFILNDISIHIIKTNNPNAISKIIATIGWLTKKFIPVLPPNNIQN